MITVYNPLLEEKSLCQKKLSGLLNYRAQPASLVRRGVHSQASSNFPGFRHAERGVPQLGHPVPEPPCILLAT
jgi:hypothetical protein